MSYYDRKYKYNRGGVYFYVDFEKDTFKIKLSNVDLSGLKLPFNVNLTSSYYLVSGEVDETACSLPLRVLNGIEDCMPASKVVNKL